MKTADYQALLVQHLSFVQDSHFVIGDHGFQPQRTLFGNENHTFYRKNGIFYTDAARTRAVQSVNGEAPETRIRRAIGANGELTWYLYALAAPAERLSMRLQYTDGEETVALHPTVSLETRRPTAQKYGYAVRGGVPFVELNEMVFGDGDQSGGTGQNDEKDKQAFHTSAQELKKYPAAVIDLARNYGGNGDLPLEWFRAYTGQAAQPNYCTLRIRASSTWLRTGYDAQNAAEEQARLAQQDAYWTESGMAADAHTTPRCRRRSFYQTMDAQFSC